MPPHQRPPLGGFGGPPPRPFHPKDPPNLLVQPSGRVKPGRPFPTVPPEKRKPQEKPKLEVKKEIEVKQETRPAAPKQPEKKLVFQAIQIMEDDDAEKKETREKLPVDVKNVKVEQVEEKKSEEVETKLPAKEVKQEKVEDVSADKYFDAHFDSNVPVDTKKILKEKKHKAAILPTQGHLVMSRKRRRANDRRLAERAIRRRVLPAYILEESPELAAISKYLERVICAGDEIECESDLTWPRMEDALRMLIFRILPDCPDIEGQFKTSAGERYLLYPNPEHLADIKSEELAVVEDHRRPPPAYDSRERRRRPRPSPPRKRAPTREKDRISKSRSSPSRRTTSLHQDSSLLKFQSGKRKREDDGESSRREKKRRGESTSTKEKKASSVGMDGRIHKGRGQKKFKEADSKSSRERSVNLSKSGRSAR